ncbi:hypothetical protein Tco_0523693 [Tanacetum coccineum]
MMKKFNKDVKYGYADPSLSDADAKYMEFCKEYIDDRLKHHDQMRRWEMYVMAGKDEGFVGIAGISSALEELPATMIVSYDNVIQKKAYNALSQSEHIDEFHKLVGDLAAIDTTILYEDQTLLLLTSLPSSYDNFVETLLYGRDTLKLEDVPATLNSRELQKMAKVKGDGGEGLYVVKGRYGERDMEWYW